MAGPRPMAETPATGAEAAPLAPAATDWLRQTLTVTGPTEGVARFRAAAAGPGIIPWQRDLDQLEEDWFLPIVAPADGVPAISLAGAKILARRLREAVAANQQRALARMATDRSCPFDLQRLRPVPLAILRLGPEDPRSQAWLWTQWGTTRALRQVRELPGQADGRRRQTSQVVIEFWSADWSPWPALVALRQAWPGLSFALRPDYRDAGDG